MLASPKNNLKNFYNMEYSHIFATVPAKNCLYVCVLSIFFMLICSYILYRY